MFWPQDGHHQAITERITGQYLVLNRDLNFKQLSNMSCLILTNKKSKQLKLQVLKLQYYFETSYSVHFNTLRTGDADLRF